MGGAYFRSGTALASGLVTELRKTPFTLYLQLVVTMKLSEPSIHS